jgi:hypothetical protein
MGNATTPVLLWKHKDNQGFSVGMPDASIPATLIHNGNFRELILEDDGVGGFSISVFEDEVKAEMHVTKVNRLGEVGLSADSAPLDTGETIVLVHEIDLEKGFHFDGTNDGLQRVDLRGSWGMSLEEIADLAPDAVAPSPACGM